MADDLPDAPWASGHSDLPDAPWVAPTEAPEKLGALEGAVEPITSIPSTYQRMVKESTEQMGRGVQQIGSGEPWDIAKGVGNVALGGLNYVTSPINAPLHTIVGKPVERLTGSPTAGSLAEMGAGFALPVPEGLPRGAAALPEEAPFGVTLSAGEKAGDLAMREAEQKAMRVGDPHAQEFVAQRVAQLQAAKEELARGLDPFGQTLAETPQEAGQLASQGVQSAAASRKAGVKQAYDQARAMPGEIHPGVFEGMSQGIKDDLALGDNPVIIDDKTTPFASKMVDDLNNGIDKLKKANPPIAEGDQIVGVNLNGVDQMRRRLSAFRKDAYASGNAADGRAAQAVLDKFDGRIDDAVNGGLFNGDKAAINAWNNARAANADYRSTFTGRNDPVGRVVQKIIGDRTNDPLTPTKVVDQIVGSSGVTPSSLNIGVANRVKSILGEQSPEWIAVKQGLLQRLVNTGEGEAALGTGAMAQRLSKFLNGDMAGVIYSPQEQATLRSYANLMRQITMPPGSYFPSAPPLQQAMAAIRSRIGGVVGALIGRQLIPIPLVGELMGLTAGAQTERALEKMHNGVTRQLPIVAQQMARWNRAQAVAQAAPTNPIMRQAALGASVNLQRALTPLGIDLKTVAQGPGAAPAYGGEGQQQNPPGPVNQKDGGRIVGQKNGFAHGGAIKGELSKVVKPDERTLYVHRPLLNGGDLDLDGVEPYKGVLKFGPEKFGEVDEDWSDKIQERAKGGAVKATKQKANYRPGSKAKRCADCTMFQPPHGCSAVQSQISPNGLCDFFERKPEPRATGGAVRRFADGGATSSSSFDAANDALNLTPQEQNLYQQHLTNLYGSGKVMHDNGQISTLFQSTVPHDGKFYNIPTVWNGAIETQPWTDPQSGKTYQVPNETAYDNVEKQGWNKYPSYDTPEEADARYGQMHDYMNQDVVNYIGAQQPPMARGGAVKSLQKAINRLQ